MMLTTSTVSSSTNHGAREDPEEAQPIEDVDQARADRHADDRDRVPAPVHVRHLVGVGARVVERERRELADERADQPRDRDQR